jgi:hypothetical protein
MSDNIVSCRSALIGCKEKCRLTPPGNLLSLAQLPDDLRLLDNLSGTELRISPRHGRFAWKPSFTSVGRKGGSR